MKPKVESFAEKADGSFMFTAIDEDRPGILYGYDNVRLVLKEGTNEIYIEHDFAASTTKDSKFTEDEIRESGQELLHKVWETTKHE